MQSLVPHLKPRILDAVVAALLHQSERDGFGIGPDPDHPLYVLRLHRQGWTRPTNRFRARLEGLMLRNTRGEWLQTLDVAVRAAACAQPGDGQPGEHMNRPSRRRSGSGSAIAADAARSARSASPLPTSRPKPAAAAAAAAATTGASEEPPPLPIAPNRQTTYVHPVEGWHAPEQCGERNSVGGGLPAGGRYSGDARHDGGPSSHLRPHSSAGSHHHGHGHQHSGRRSRVESTSWEMPSGMEEHARQVVVFELEVELVLRLGEGLEIEMRSALGGGGGGGGGGGCLAGCVLPTVTMHGIEAHVRCPRLRVWWDVADKKCDIVFVVPPRIRLRVHRLTLGGCIAVHRCLPVGKGVRGPIARAIEDALADFTIDNPIELDLDPDNQGTSGWDTVRKAVRETGARGLKRRVAMLALGSTLGALPGLPLPSPGAALSATASSMPRTSRP